LSCFGQVFGVTFVVNGQLFAGVYAVVRLGHDFQPDLGGARVFAAALGHQRKLAARLRAEFRRQPHRQGLRARGVRAIFVPPALEKSRQPKEIEAFDFVGGAGRFGKQRVDFAEESGEAAQIHLIVAHDSGERLGGPAAQVIEIKLRYECGRNIVLAMPAQPGRVEDVAFEFHEPHRTEAKFPQRARGMQ